MTSLFRNIGRVFVQDDQDDPFWLLTCTGAGDVAIPSGDETPVYCPDPASLGNFIIDGAVEGEAGFTTFSLNRPLQNVLNYLLTELHHCRFNTQIPWGTKGDPPDVWTSYLTALHLHSCRVTSRTVGQPVVLSAADNDRVETSADINSYYAWLYYPLTATRIALTEVSGINGIAFDLSESCNVEEIGGDLKGKEGYFTTDHTATSPAVSADVWYTTDYGSTWTLCAADPFAAAEDAGPVQTRGGRVIVGRITADVGNPAEIAYSDDYGAVWVNVDVGAVDNQIVKALWWQDWSHLWAACSGGYVYFSEDAGESWAVQTAGTVTAQNLWDICAYDVNNVWAVGGNGAIIGTTNGTDWAAVNGPPAVADQFNTVFMLNSNRVFVGSDAGNAYRTSDGGTNWITMTTPQWAGGEVRRIRGDMDRRYTIFIAGDTRDPVGAIYRSRDGGASFQVVQDMDTNAGLNDLAVIDHNVAFGVGEPQGGTAFMVKVHETS